MDKLPESFRMQVPFLLLSLYSLSVLILVRVHKWLFEGLLHVWASVALLCSINLPDKLERHFGSIPLLFLLIAFFLLFLLPLVYMSLKSSHFILPHKVHIPFLQWSNTEKLYGSIVIHWLVPVVCTSCYCCH